MLIHADPPIVNIEMENEKVRKVPHSTIPPLAVRCKFHIHILKSFKGTPISKEEEIA